MRPTVLNGITTGVTRTIDENLDLVIQGIEELYFMMSELDLSTKEDRVFLKTNIQIIKKFYEALERGFINERRTATKK
jgi:hypothetical protein